MLRRTLKRQRILKNFSQKIIDIALKIDQKYSSVNLYFQDESRFGLHTKYGRGLTAKGVQPVCAFQQVFTSTYLFGAFSPITGDKLLLELPQCNAFCFQIFIDALAAQNENEFKIVVLDNGAFHKSKELIIPENIMLVFLPPYSPELNPAEKIWHRFKREFTNQLYKNLDEVSQFFTKTVSSLTREEVISICSFSYIFDRLNWSI